MFDILVYLYETYYRPEACPDPEALAKKLCAVGFDEDEISEAIDWLAVMKLTSQNHHIQPNPGGFRIFASQEVTVLGSSAIGFIQFLESAKLINPQQREIIIERALAVNETPISLDKLKIIVLMMLWSQGKEPDLFMFDELLLSDEQTKPPLLH
jgi:Smg protein